MKKILFPILLSMFLAGPALAEPGKKTESNTVVKQDKSYVKKLKRQDKKNAKKMKRANRKIEKVKVKTREPELRKRRGY